MDDQHPIADPHRLADEAALRALYGQAEGLAVRKSMVRIDRHARDFIARSPFLCIATSNAQGRTDVSPRGDQPGFVQVLDEQHLAIPDRPGNNRLDTMVNIVENPNIGLIFMIPGFEDTLRVNGKAEITTDPAILERAMVDRKLPKTAIRLRVEEQFFHCAKAFRRSRLWLPEAIVDRKVMPTLARIILDQTEEAVRMKEEELAAIDVELEESYKKEMY